jgi:hypothetical protein
LSSEELGDIFGINIGDKGATTSVKTTTKKIKKPAPKKPTKQKKPVKTARQK